MSGKAIWDETKVSADRARQNKQDDVATARRDKKLRRDNNCVVVMRHLMMANQEKLLQDVANVRKQGNKVRYNEKRSDEANNKKWG
jgi:hypothetical protein